MSKPTPCPLPIGMRAERACEPVTDKKSNLGFVLGAMWAYETLTGALIVPASFEERAREAMEEKP